MPGVWSSISGLWFDNEPGEFIQILHTGDGHWVTISTIGTTHPTVHIYDSLYTSAGAKLKAQIACLLCTEQSEINLKFLDVPMQSGT